MAAETADLSVIVIARNEERDLPACLDSVAGLAREVVVVDDHSTDRTADLARARGARLLTRKLDTFAAQKQFALENATSGWVLELDADEALTPELRAEILAATSDSRTEAGFHLHRLNRFMGGTLRFGGQGGQYKLRLFRRAKARFEDRRVHEAVTVDGPTGRLEAPFLHTPYADLGEYFAKFDRYTELAARDRYERGVRWRLWHHLVLPAVFAKCYFLRLGFLDGTAGFVWAVLSGLYHWTKFVRLKELEAARGAGV